MWSMRSSGLIYFRRPIIRSAGHGVEADKTHPLVIHTPVGFVEESPPFRTHVVIPVVLARNEHLSSLDFRQELNPERELIGSAELGQVAAEDQKVGRQVDRLHWRRA